MKPALRVVLAAVLALVAAAGLLAACSGSPQEDYCAEVEDRREALSEAGAGAGLLEVLPEFEALAEAAPRDIADAWAIVVQRVSNLADALEAADVDPATYDPEKPPEGLEEEERKRIVSAAQGLVDRDSLHAIGEVQQHALDVCGVQLGL